MRWRSCMPGRFWTQLLPRADFIWGIADILWHFYNCIFLNAASSAKASLPAGAWTGWGCGVTRLSSVTQFVWPKSVVFLLPICRWFDIYLDDPGCAQKAKSYFCWNMLLLAIKLRCLWPRIQRLWLTPWVAPDLSAWRNMISASSNFWWLHLWKKCSVWGGPPKRRGGCIAEGNYCSSRLDPILSIFFSGTRM